MRGFLGIDVGSISTNFVLMSEAREVVFQCYVRGSGSPVQSVQACTAEMGGAMRKGMEIAAVCTTGSGRELTGAVIGADIIKNEISTHARAAVALYPGVRTVIEIGGQDSKVTILEDGAVVDFAMNLVCAAGTGSFLDSQARRLEISIEELGERAILSRRPTAIAGRCTVFAESDMIHKQQMGHAQEDILMGLCQALVRNFIGNVARGKELRPPVLLQGGVSANPGIVRAFEEALGFPVVVPEYHMVMGAYGAALLAMERAPVRTRFRGIGVSQHAITSRAFACRDCPNGCEIIEILDGTEMVGRTGGRCGKW